MAYPDFNYSNGKTGIYITKCPICDYLKGIAKDIAIGNGDIINVECGRCGKFKIEREAVEENTKIIKDNSAKISGYIKLFNEAGKTCSMITSENIDKILKDPTLPKADDIEKKAEFLLESLKRRTQYFGKPVKLKNDEDYPLAFAKNAEEFDALLKFLKESDYLKYSRAVSEAFNYSNIELTAKGWKFFQNSSERSKSKNVFIASWFGDSMNESITAICDIVRKHKLEPICIRDEDFKERIMDKALGEIKNSKFLIVDLTNHRPAVLFEAGFAHALGIDMIFVHKKGDKDHVTTGFYTSHFKIHEYNDIEELKNKLDDVIPVRIT